MVFSSVVSHWLRFERCAVVMVARHRLTMSFPRNHLLLYCHVAAEGFAQ